MSTKMGEVHQSSAILLPKTIPQKLLVMFDGYLHQFHEQNFLLCSSFEDCGFFLKIEMKHNDKNKPDWSVRIQTQYVLAIADMSNNESYPIGFLG